MTKPVTYNDLTQEQQLYLGLRRSAFLARDNNRLQTSSTLRQRARETPMPLNDHHQARQIANTLIDLWFLFRWMRLQS